MFYDRRLLAFCDGETGYVTLSKRLCDYQQDLHEIEVKLNKFNRILRRPLLHIRDRDAWVQRQYHQEPENFDDIYEHYRETGRCGRGRFVKKEKPAQSAAPERVSTTSAKSRKSESRKSVKSGALATEVPTGALPLSEEPRPESAPSEPAEPEPVLTQPETLPPRLSENNGPVLNIMSLSKLPRGPGVGMYSVKVGFDENVDPASFVLGTINATKAEVKNGKEGCVIGQSLKLPVDDRHLRVGILRNDKLIGIARFNSKHPMLKLRAPPVVPIKDPVNETPLGGMLRVRCGAPANNNWPDVLSDDEYDDDDEEEFE